MILDSYSVRDAVAMIADHKDDAEVAHDMEDRLYEDVIRAIRDGTCIDPRACCEEALKTKDIDFSRWCA